MAKLNGRQDAIGATAVQMVAAYTHLQKGVWIKADRNNTTDVAVGWGSTVTFDGADTTAGHILTPDVETFMPINNDVSGDAKITDIYVIGSGAGPAKVSYWGY